MGTHTIWLRCVVEADSPVDAGVKLLGARDHRDTAAPRLRYRIRRRRKYQFLDF